MLIRSCSVLVLLLLPLPLLAEDAPQFAGKKAGDLWEGNGLKMKFRWCPPGQFTMGSPESETWHTEDENQVSVTHSRGFWLGQYEVTQTEWQKVMGTTIGQQAAKGTETALAGTGSSHPMYYVNWEEAAEFCRRLTAQERSAGRLPLGWEYTLPTEAQWEYACRAGTTTATAFGDIFIAKQANVCGLPASGAAKGEYDYKTQTVAVGSYRGNAWNLYDMHGNVWEWCRDWHADKRPGGIDPEIVDQTAARVSRGGSWHWDSTSSRSANRNRFAPVVREFDKGFRVALVSTR